MLLNIADICKTPSQTLLHHLLLIPIPIIRHEQYVLWFWLLLAVARLEVGMVCPVADETVQDAGGIAHVLIHFLDSLLKLDLLRGRSQGGTLDCINGSSAQEAKTGGEMDDRAGF